MSNNSWTGAISGPRIQVSFFPYMGMNKLFALAHRLEEKLKKMAAMPDEASVKQIIMDVYSSMKSNPALKGTQGIAPQVSISSSIGEKVLVYFQVIATPRDYVSLVEEPSKSNLVNTLKPAVEQALQSHFRNYEFKVTVGIVL